MNKDLDKVSGIEKPFGFDFNMPFQLCLGEYHRLVNDGYPPFLKSCISTVLREQELQFENFMVV